MHTANTSVAGVGWTGNAGCATTAVQKRSIRKASYNLCTRQEGITGVQQEQ